VKSEEAALLKVARGWLVRFVHFVSVVCDDRTDGARGSART